MDHGSSVGLVDHLVFGSRRNSIDFVDFIGLAGPPLSVINFGFLSLLLSS